MNKQILSAAIALLIVMASAASSFASDAVRISQVTTTPVRTDAIKPALSNTVQPDLSKPLIQNGGLVNSPQLVSPEGLGDIPGGDVKPKPPKPPRPPRIPDPMSLSSKTRT